MAPKVAIVFVCWTLSLCLPSPLTRSSTRCTATSSSWPRLRRRVLKLLAARPTSTSKFAIIPREYTKNPKLTTHNRIPETLPEEVLTKMHAPPKSAHPIATPEDLLNYDAVLFGIPTRYGNFPAQWKTFWDRTGGIWATGGFWGKYAGLFVSTGTLGGGQESTAIAAMSTLAHHGFLYVPLGYKTTFAQLSNLTEIHGGSAWGAGTFAVCSLSLLFGSTRC